MAVAAEIEAGKFYVNGIQGTITLTSAGPVTHSMNIGDRTLSKQFQLNDVPTQDGVTLASRIATMQKHVVTYNFYPESTSRALCIAEIAELEALTALAVMTITAAGSGTQTPALASIAGTYNLMSDLSFREVRDGLFVCAMNLERVQTAADGTVYSALTIAS